MTVVETSSYISFADWYRQGPLSSHVRTIKSSGNFLSLVEAVQPAGDMSDPATPDLVLVQDMGTNGLNIRADLGAGRFKTVTQRGSMLLIAPNFADTFVLGEAHHFRALSFPTVEWARLMDTHFERDVGFDFGRLHKGAFTSVAIRSAVQRLWNLCDDDAAPSRLLAQAAGCGILAELFHLRGEFVTTARGGLAPWAKNRCLELMRERLAEDISLEELANEARLSPFHFSRMFKESVGVSPRIHLVRLRIEKACELLMETDLSVVEIALEVGYSSSQVLARAFMQHKNTNPVAYRRSVRN